MIKYMQYLNEMKTSEMEYGRLWSKCQSCQGSFHREVICKARDCDIFYVRTRAKLDLEENRRNVERFEGGEVDYGW
jgi:DNA polymerase delta subunit 1